MKLPTDRLTLLRIGCILHALVVTGIWVLVFQFDIDVLSAKIWLVVAVLWSLWMTQVLVPFRGNRADWLKTVALGLVLIAPTLRTQYTFIVWAVEGFAP